MRYLILFGVTIVNLIFMGAVFPNINIAGIAPDFIICTIVSIAIIEKNMTGAVLGLICGLTLDLLFSGAFGFFSIPYLATGAIIYYVCTKITYIDNYIVPFSLAVGAYLIKELLFGLLVYMMGINYSLSHIFIRYILPEAFLTGSFMFLIHFIFKRIYRSSRLKSKKPETLSRL